jgi:hypothetical protein
MAMGHDSAMTTTYQEKFGDAEWNLLVGLPHAVASAASLAEADGTRRTRIEGEAGLAAIADGRELGSPLVREIAAQLIERIGGDPELGEEPPVVVAPEDPAAYVDDTLERADRAVRVLAGQVDEGDAGAYRHWLVTIAERVVAAASSGGVLGLGGERVTEAEQTFLQRLGVTLND